MFRKWANKWVVVAVLLLSGWAASAQTDGTFTGFSPYSVFGMGQLHQGGTAWNRSMGGVGIAARSNRYINITNPASMTARDSLSLMVDFGLDGRISLFTEGNKKALNTTFNIDDFVISFPLWKHTAMMVGITPVSDVGYKISYSEMDVDTGYRTFTSSGNGGIYQVFAAFAATLWNRLSLGAQANYRFGNINKKASIVYDDASFRNMASGDSLQVNNFTAKLGLQYEQPLSTRSFLTLGATYQFATGLTGYTIHYEELGDYYRNREDDTLGSNQLGMGDEIGVGLSYRYTDKLLIEVDYTRTDWTRSGLNAVKGFSNVGDAVFKQSVGQSFRAGFAYTPNRNDIRYPLKRWTYRGGVYFDQSYYTVDGAHVNAIGITLGTTLPVFRWYNGLTVGLDFGRRGLSTSQVKETYFGFNVGLNVFDIWFQKRPYE
jgi:hypothetical protein